MLLPAAAAAAAPIDRFERFATTLSICHADIMLSPLFSPPPPLIFAIPMTPPLPPFRHADVDAAAYTLLPRYAIFSRQPWLPPLTLYFRRYLLASAIDALSCYFFMPPSSAARYFSFTDDTYAMMPPALA